MLYEGSWGDVAGVKSLISWPRRNEESGKRERKVAGTSVPSHLETPPVLSHCLHISPECQKAASPQSMLSKRTFNSNTIRHCNLVHIRQ